MFDLQDSFARLHVGALNNGKDKDRKEVLFQVSLSMWEISFPGGYKLTCMGTGHEKDSIIPVMWIWIAL